MADEKTWELISKQFLRSPSSQLENDETARIIKLLTDKLSPKQKTVFILSEIEEMSSDEISEITGMSKTVIKCKPVPCKKKYFGNDRKIFMKMEQE